MSDQSSPSPVTLADVAAHAGVSMATASRALNGSSRVVNAEMTERVLASSRELGYSANALAQAVARGSTRTVAVVLGDVADPYFSSIAAGVIEEAEKNDLVVTMWATGSQPDRLLATLKAMRGQRPQVLIIAQSGHLDPEDDEPITDELAALQKSGTTVCTIGEASGGFRRLLVGNYEAASELAIALVARGYSRFVVLRGDPTLRTPTERSDGFRAGLKSAGLEPIAVEVGGFSRAGALETMAEALASGLRPDCVFAVTDVMALGAAAALRAAGLEPGVDVGVAGFDDIESVRDVTPAMTTVAIPLAELGSRALRVALAGESEPDEGSIAGEVVLRESTPVR